MIVHVGNSSAIVAPVTLEETDKPQYIGHYTISALKLFIEEIEKKYQSDRMLSIKTIYNDGYIMMAATPDDDGEVRNDYIAMAGCSHGINGNE